MKKNILILTTVILLSSCATKTSFHSFYKENKEASTMSIGAPSVFANLFIPKEDIDEYKEVFKKVRHYRMMIFSDNAHSIEQKFERFIKRKKYNTIFRISKNGENVQFYFLENKKVIKEVILKIESDNSYLLFGLKTNLKEKHLNNLINNSDVTLTSISK